MGFSADTFRAPMDYDLTSVGGPKGTIPEPSTNQIIAYFDGLRRLTAPESPPKYDDDGTLRPAEDFEADLVKYEADAAETNLASARLLEGVTSGTITAETFVALPHRIQQSFATWLNAELRPEA